MSLRDLEKKVMVLERSLTPGCCFQCGTLLTCPQCDQGRPLDLDKLSVEELEFLQRVIQKAASK